MDDSNHRLERFADLVRTDAAGLPHLGPGPRPGVDSASALETKLNQFFETHAITPPQADLLRCVALLWHDQLDAAHEICQDMHDADGAWMHGILHRREPDYANARYWFHRVGTHPAYSTLQKKVCPTLLRSRSSALEAQAASDEWKPELFITACAAAERSGDQTEVALLQSIQASEFEVLWENFLARV